MSAGDVEERDVVRATYQSPRLRRYGDIGALTAATTDGSHINDGVSGHGATKTAIAFNSVLGSNIGLDPW